MFTFRSMIPSARLTSTVVLVASSLAGCGDDPSTPAVDASAQDLPTTDVGRDVPDVPEARDVPDAGDVPDVPEAGDVPDVPEAGDVPDVRDVQGDGGLPANLVVPAGHTEILRVAARGEQIYVCTAPAVDAGVGAGPSWVFRAPEATLYDAAGHLVGQHFVGPSWRAVDGSQVAGAAAQRADAPRAGAIPWLLLGATTRSGSGVFSNVSYIQRIDTEGGVAPTTGCDASTVATERRVTYSANYVFWAPTMDAAAPALPLPSSLDLPTSGRSVTLRAAARGVQIYRCTATAGDAGAADAGAPYQWVFTAPEATLYDAAMNVIGSHSAGPRWRGADGSEVVGTVVARNPAPDATAIPWLLLSGAPTSAAGIFGRARFIHRVATVGGVAPTTGCNAGTVGTDARVDYTADYYFWGE